MHRHSRKIGIASVMLLMGYNSNLLAQYTTEGRTVTLDGNSWLQVQAMDASLGLAGCQDTKSCTVDTDGNYRIIDFGTQPATRHDNIALATSSSSSNPSGSSAGYIIQGLTVTLDSNSWLQIQPMDSNDGLTGCEGTKTCTVAAAGNYRIIDFTTNPATRNDNIALTAAGGTTHNNHGVIDPDLNVAAIHASYPRNENGKSGGAFLRRQNDGYPATVETSGGIPFHQTAATLNDPGLVLETALFAQGHTDDATRVPADGEGNFRITCQWSHFAYNDALLANNIEGGSHLHMYWGKTNADHTTDLPNELTSSGGGSCQGFSLNRSAYWMPALMTDAETAIVPENITIYYKTKVKCQGGHKPRHNAALSSNVADQYECVSETDGSLGTDGANVPLFLPKNTAEMKPGLQLFSGNPSSQDLVITNKKEIYWSCGSNGNIKNGAIYNTIPSLENCQRDNRDEWPEKGQYHPLNASIYFPQCVKIGRLRGETESTFDHLVQKADWEACPSGYENIPRLGFLVYWNLNHPDITSTANWFLASDHHLSDQGAATSQTKRGGTLHADWIGGWHPKVQKAWLKKCLQESNNCAQGHTGTAFGLHNLHGSQAPSGEIHPMNFYDAHANENNANTDNVDRFVHVPHGAMLPRIAGTNTEMEPEVEPQPEPQPEPEPEPEPELIPELIGSEVLRSTDFEINNVASGSGWFRYGSNVVISTEWQGYNSSRSALVTGLAGNRHGIRQNIFSHVENGTITQGSTINVSAFMKLHSNLNQERTGKIELLWRDDNNWNWKTIASSTVNNWGWNQISGSTVFNWVGEIDRLHLIVNGPGNGESFLIDNVQTGVETNDVQPAGVEIIRNGDYEVNNVASGSGWYRYGPNVAISTEWQGYDSSRSALATGLTGNRHGIRQSIIAKINDGTITRGSTINVSAYIKLHSALNQQRTGKLELLWRDDNNWNWHTVGSNQVNNWEWTRIEGSWNIDWVGDIDRLHFVINGPGNGESFLVDDVSVTVQ